MFRIERIDSELQKSLADIINNRLKDPRLEAMVSVLKVDVAKDLKTAKVYVSLYGEPEKVKTAFEVLGLSAGFIRRELAHDFRALRNVPQLTFLLDTSEEYSQKINAILKEIEHDAD